MSEVEVREVRPEELEELLPLIAGYQTFYGAEPDTYRNRTFFSRFLHPSEAGLLLGAWTEAVTTGWSSLPGL